MSEPTDTQTGIPKLRRQLRQIIADWIVENWKVVLGALSGAIVGFTTGYIAIMSQIGDARHAAANALESSKETAAQVHELTAQIRSLVTERELGIVEDQVKEIQDRLDYATEQTKLPPHHRKEEAGTQRGHQ